MSDIEIISPPSVDFSPREAVMYHEMIKARGELSQYVSMLYFLVTKFGEQGETFKLTVTEASKVKVPTSENQLNWNYDRENDIITFEISEPNQIAVVSGG